MPFFLSHSMAFSMSPPTSFSAFLESMMPAPERWRSSLTCAAVTSTSGPASTLGDSSFGAAALGASSLGTSSVGTSSLGGAGATSSLVRYLASSFSTPAAKSASFFSKPSPRLSRENRRITMFSPSFAILSFKTSWTVFSSSFSHFCDKSAISSNRFLSLPSTIFSLMLSGLPARSSFAVSISLSLAMMSAGTSSTLTELMAGFAAICIATSEANSLKISLFATKSVSEFTSAITPILLLKCTYEAMPPSTATLPAFLSAFAMPFFFNQSIALSMSPPHSFKAFWQSKIPARDRSRNAFTIAPVTFSPAMAATAIFGSSIWPNGVKFLNASSLPCLPIFFSHNRDSYSHLLSKESSPLPKRYLPKVWPCCFPRRVRRTCLKFKANSDSSRAPRATTAATSPTAAPPTTKSAADHGEVPTTLGALAAAAAAGFPAPRSTTGCAVKPCKADDLGERPREPTKPEELSKLVATAAPTQMAAMPGKQRVQFAMAPRRYRAQSR
mmetsp:Transcript_75356/g.209396  ORF Transcript_75356/g.209396 Transcript_75356/m.209396 type:complete len:499 (+) Transcript_75356:326-1822(+)